ncbi:MAG: thiamine-phosphate kinase [Bacteroidia bacterium]|nr:thiamine-phosphate kinase [Bacteroidia bacterium]
MNENKTPLGNLGKYGLIDHLAKKIKAENKSTIKGIGDDAVVIDSGGKYALVSTDLLLEGIHFNLIYTPLKHLGYKSVIRAISDIYAMNGTPGQLLIAFGISSKFFVEQIEEIYEGALLACNKYNVDLAGGDTTSSLTGLTISVTAVGTVDKKDLVKRDGARPNDLIYVTGDLGAAYTGLQLLERERKIFEQKKSIQPDLGGNDYVIGRQLKPEFPAGVLDDLRKAGIKPTSMIDITEGLASDLMQITRSSGTGCRIFHKNIPIDYETSRLAEEFNIDPLIPALNGGDDFELLFTVPLEMIDKVREIDKVKAIGHITEKGSGNYVVGADGSEVELTAQGWKKQ